MMLFAVVFNFAEPELFGLKSLSVTNLSCAELFEKFQPKLSSSSQDPHLQHVFVVL